MKWVAVLGCVAAAAYLAAHGFGYWGWFLVGAVLIAMSST